MCRKPNRTHFQLPGGFFDPTKDKSLENTALRELFEETNVCADVIQYVGSYVIDDFRYKNEIDRIITTLFEVVWIEGEPEPKDDIIEVKWVDISYVINNLDTFVFPAHHKLLIDIVQFCQI
jgi:bifunctional NMN adenylyltransferase/nudix hydrolase